MRGKRSEGLTVRDAPVGLFKLHDGGEVICISEYLSKVNGRYFRDAYIVSSGEVYHGGDGKTGCVVDLKEMSEKLQAAEEKIESLEDKLEESYQNQMAAENQNHYLKLCHEYRDKFYTAKEEKKILRAVVKKWLSHSEGGAYAKDGYRYSEAELRYFSEEALEKVKRGEE